MKKTMAFLSGLIMIMNLTISSAYAADDKNTDVPTPKEIVSELEEYETPYYKENFDFNNDGQVDVFDMIALKKKLVSGEDGITIATAVKLQRWLHGQEDSLAISELASSYYKPSEFKNDYIKNLMSNDFRFIGVYECSWVHTYGDDTPGVELRFLGVDEYVLTDILIYNFCNSSNEFDEFIAEGTGYSLGIKNGLYTLALNEKPTTIEEMTEQAVSEEPLELLEK